ncbi:hypothetical protein EDC04DRAFT_2838177 [Pisolithus marmoratus]|nr:hypothetical protein EDC04DRAFT_2838177 [Pisolithus marmoratus]
MFPLSPRSSASCLPLSLQMPHHRSQVVELYPLNSASATSPSGNIEGENGALSSTLNHAPDHVPHITNYAELQAIGPPSRYQQENWNVSTFRYPFRFYNSTNATVSNFSNTSPKLNLFLHRSHKHCRRSRSHRLAYVLDDLTVEMTSEVVDDYGSFDANEGNSGQVSALTPRYRAWCHQTRPCLPLKSRTPHTAVVARVPEYPQIRQPLSAPL